jgi:hypothetical protein
MTSGKSEEASRNGGETSAARSSGAAPGALLDLIADAIEAARCPGREGPYGLYDYSLYPGDGPPHAVRDFRDPRSPDFGAVVYRSPSGEDAAEMFETLTRRHIAAAALRAARKATGEEL